MVIYLFFNACPAGVYSLHHQVQLGIAFAEKASELLKRPMSGFQFRTRQLKNIKSDFLS